MKSKQLFNKGGGAIVIVISVAIVIFLFYIINNVSREGLTNVPKPSIQGYTVGTNGPYYNIKNITPNQSISLGNGWIHHHCDPVISLYDMYQQLNTTLLISNFDFYITNPNYLNVMKIYISNNYSKDNNLKTFIDTKHTDLIPKGPVLPIPTPIDINNTKTTCYMCKTSPCNF